MLSCALDRKAHSLSTPLHGDSHSRLQRPVHQGGYLPQARSFSGRLCMYRSSSSYNHLHVLASCRRLRIHGYHLAGDDKREEAIAKDLPALPYLHSLSTLLLPHTERDGERSMSRYPSRDRMADALSRNNREVSSSIELSGCVEECILRRGFGPAGPGARHRTCLSGDQSRPQRHLQALQPQGDHGVGDQRLPSSPRDRVREGRPEDRHGARRRG